MFISKQSLRREARVKEGAACAKRFEEEAHAAWAEKDINKKKALIEATMIAQFEYPAKAEEFRKKVQQAKNTQTLDKLVGDLVLYASGLSVLKR